MKLKMTMYKIDQALSAQQIEEICQKMLQFACLQQGIMTWLKICSGEFIMCGQKYCQF